MSPEELDAALHKANETMKAYYSYPPEKVMALKKAKFNERHRDKQFYFQLALGELVYLPRISQFMEACVLMH